MSQIHRWIVWVCLIHRFIVADEGRVLLRQVQTDLLWGCAGMCITIQIDSSEGEGSHGADVLTVGLYGYISHLQVDSSEGSLWVRVSNTQVDSADVVTVGMCCNTHFDRGDTNCGYVSLYTV